MTATATQPTGQEAPPRDGDMPRSKVQTQNAEDALIVLAAIAGLLGAGRLLAGHQKYRTMLRRSVYAGAGAALGTATALLASEAVSPDPRPISMAGLVDLCGESAIATGATVYGVHLTAATVRW